MAKVLLIVGYSIAVDASGHAYLTGYVEDTNFPATPGAFQITHNGGNQDAFVAKMNPQGNDLIYATYLGGNQNDAGSSIVVDIDGNAYVAGWTWSTNFPTTPGAFQTNFGNGPEAAFVTKLNAIGSVPAYSTFLGSTDFSAARGQYISGIAVDNAGNVYVAGTTTLSDFPITPGAFQTTYSGGADVFVSKLAIRNGNGPTYQCDPEIYYGVQHCTDENHNTHFLIVDLDDPHVKVQTVLSSLNRVECNSVNPNDPTRGNHDPTSNCPYPYPFETVRAMLERYRNDPTYKVAGKEAVAIINTDYFAHETGNNGAQGLAVRRGVRLDGQTHNDNDDGAFLGSTQPSLAFSPANHATIGVPGSEQTINDNLSRIYSNTVGGAPIIIQNGQWEDDGCTSSSYAGHTCSSTYQSAAGLTNDDRLILITASKSAAGIADYLISPQNNFGVHTALKFDGGGSASMAWVNSAGQTDHYYAQTGSTRAVAEGLLILSEKIVIDDFNRANGVLGSDWAGNKAKAAYKIVNQQVDVGKGGPLYWRPQVFGADQEVSVKLITVDTRSAFHGLLLKVQNKKWQKGAIFVIYDAKNQSVYIQTYVPQKGYSTLATFNAVIQNGSQFRARAEANGTVRVLINDIEIGNANAGAFFANKGGRIGLWFTGAANAEFDDFNGGGTIVLSATDIQEEYDPEFDGEPEEEEEQVEAIFLPLIAR